MICSYVSKGMHIHVFGLVIFVDLNCNWGVIVGVISQSCSRNSSLHNYNRVPRHSLQTVTMGTLNVVATLLLWLSVIQARAQIFPGLVHRQGLAP